MNWKHYTLFGLFAVLILWTYRAHSSYIADWNADSQLKNAQATALAFHKPLLLDFNATWCGPCQFMKTQTLTDPKVIESLRKFEFVSIDIDQHPQAAAQLGVNTIPAFFVVDPQTGKVLKENRDGAMSAQDFLAWLN